jgi:hypothetical protein
VKLLVSNGHSYGPGKTHIKAAEKSIWGTAAPICQPKGIFATEKKGSINDVTCKVCLRLNDRDPSRASS